jgi:hypothetical protein
VEWVACVGRLNRVGPTGRRRFASASGLATTAAPYDHAWDRGSAAGAARGVLKHKQKRQRGGVTFYF